MHVLYLVKQHYAILGIYQVNTTIHMRLYYASGSCALSPHIVVRELGLNVEIEKVVFGDGVRTTEPHKENYYEVNPRGYVPALKLDSGDIMTEGAAIVQYLAD